MRHTEISIVGACSGWPLTTRAVLAERRVNLCRVNGVEDEPDALPRDERRRRTSSAILDAARQQFGEHGFERTTIRGVAAQAGIDPALVMQYYGNKEQLFASAARWSEEDSRVEQAQVADVPTAALADLFGHFEDAPDREAMIAVMRNCLTHPTAAHVLRDDVMGQRAAAVASKIEGPDAELRAALVGACMLGLGMSRYLLDAEPVASASREQIVRCFAPALRALVERVPPAERDR